MNRNMSRPAWARLWDQSSNVFCGPWYTPGKSRFTMEQIQGFRQEIEAKQSTKIQDFLVDSFKEKMVGGDLDWNDDATDLVRWCGRMAEEIEKKTFVVEKNHGE